MALKSEANVIFQCSDSIAWKPFNDFQKFTYRKTQTNASIPDILRK